MLPQLPSLLLAPPLPATFSDLTRRVHPQLLPTSHCPRVYQPPCPCRQGRVHRPVLQVRAALLQHRLLAQHRLPHQLHAPQPRGLQDLHVRLLVAEAVSDCQRHALGAPPRCMLPRLLL